MEESVGPYLGSPDGTNDSRVVSNANGLLLRPLAAGEKGEGLPYAPEDWPNPGDKWLWRIGKDIRRKSCRGYWLRRFLYPPKHLRMSMGTVRKCFECKTEVRAYLAKEFPDTDIDSFFSSFQWRIPCTDQAAREATQEQKKRARSPDSSYDSEGQHTKTQDESSNLAMKSPVDLSRVVEAEDPLTARCLSFGIESDEMPSSSLLKKKKGSKRGDELLEEIDRSAFIQTTTSQDVTGVVPDSITTDTPGNVIAERENVSVKCAATGKSSCTHPTLQDHVAATETAVQLPFLSPNPACTDHPLTIHLQRFVKGTQIPEAIQQGLSIAARLVTKRLKLLPLEALGEKMKYFNDHLEWFVNHKFPIEEFKQELNIRSSTIQGHQNRRGEIEADLNKIEATIARLEQEVMELHRQADELRYEKQHLFTDFSY